MASLSVDAGSPQPKFLDRARIVTDANFNRWLFPPCALAVHLCIGMAYGFSVFWLPLSRALGVAKPVVCKGMTLGQAITTTTCDWRVSDLVWTYSVFFVVLGAAAAMWGGWLERVGPRKAGIVATCCWCGGMAIGAIGVSVHQLWLLWLGCGLIGGIGLGIGYISPVSTLIKWFPDRRGLATGMAIMGFGGGAMIGSPLADKLMKAYADAGQVGVWQTFLTLAVIYAVAMTAGALGYRVPPEGYRPAGWTPPVAIANSARGYVPLERAHKTPQFWLIWTVLLLNVSASIGIIGVASPMLQEVFGGRLIHQAVSFGQFTAAQKTAAAAAGAGFVGLISLFNIGGRFLWASSSDRFGRKVTFAVMTALGAVLYGLVAPALVGGSLGLFVLVFCLCASMYGGGFATVPAYLADVFGTRYVGAIHGRLLTAWSTAGVLGPYIVTTIRDRGLAAGLPSAQLYPPIYWILGGLLVAAFVVNLMIRPVADSHFVHEDTAHTPAAAAAVTGSGGEVTPVVVLCWALVVGPLAWGVWMTVAKVLVLLH